VYDLYTWKEVAVRTNVVIDDRLMNEAMKAGSFKTKKAAIEAGLRLLTQRQAQEALLALRGKIHWEGDLDAMRRDKRSW
jgi:Arc/MetJ family transcription regulator